MENEIWKDISGYEGLYQISNYGKIKSLSRFQSATERILKSEINKCGYVRIRLSYKNVSKKYQVHRIVALTFIPNPENKPCVNHINGIKSDNRAKNLEWCTNSENMKHAFKNGLQSLDGEKNNMSKLTESNVIEIKNLLSNGIFHKDIALLYNVSRRCITDINKGLTWKNIR